MCSATLFHQVFSLGKRNEFPMQNSCLDDSSTRNLRFVSGVLEEYLGGMQSPQSSIEIDRSRPILSQQHAVTKDISIPTSPSMLALKGSFDVTCSDSVDQFPVNKYTSVCSAHRGANHGLKGYEGSGGDQYHHSSFASSLLSGMSVGRQNRNH